jgi:ABC-type antimicrobial peptide transport system permease subunit
MTIFVRSAADAARIAPQIRAAVRQANPLQPAYNVMTLERIVFAPLARPRLVAAMVGVFGAFALIIAIVGVYGTMWCAVNARRPEIAVRLALGGSPTRVRAMLIGQGLKGVALGIAVGLPVAQGLTYALASQLVAVRHGDWSTATLVSLTVLGLGFLGCARPAIAATSASPIAALKRE